MANINIDLFDTQKTVRWMADKLYISSKQNQRSWRVKRGEVYYVDFGVNIGSEENKKRPCLVLQSNAYNFKSPVFLGAVISTSPVTIKDIQVPITSNYTYTDKKMDKKLTGTIDLGQIKTIAKERIIYKMTFIKDEMSEVDEKLFNIFGLSDILNSKNNTINSLNGKIEYLKNKE